MPEALEPPENGRATRYEVMVSGDRGRDSGKGGEPGDEVLLRFTDVARAGALEKPGERATEMSRSPGIFDKLRAENPFSTSPDGRSKLDTLPDSANGYTRVAGEPDREAEATVIDRMSEGSLQALDLAQQEADRLRHAYVGTEHLLLGLLRQTEAGASAAPRASGLDLAAALSGIERLILQGAVPSAQHQAWGQPSRIGRLWRSRRSASPPACGRPLLIKRALEMAVEEANTTNETEVTPNHLLLGLLRDAADPLGTQMGRRGRRSLSRSNLKPGGPNPVRLLVEARGLTLESLRASLRGL